MKKFFSSFLIFLILFSFCSQIANCQIPSPTDGNETINSTDNIVETTNDQTKEELVSENIFLNEQLEIMRFYDQRLLNTVYWALSVIVAITIGLVAYSWFTNNKLYEKDKKNIKDELELELSLKFLEFDSKASLELENKKNEFLKNLNKELETIKSDLLTELTETKKDIVRIKLDILMQEANNWYEQPVYVNAVLTYTNILSTAKLIEFNSHHVGIALEKLLDSLKHITDKKRFAAFQLAEIRNVLDDIPGKFDNFRVSILSSIDELLNS